jgi:hypothetical protein
VQFEHAQAACQARLQNAEDLHQALINGALV